MSGGGDAPRARHGAVAPPVVVPVAERVPGDAAPAPRRSWVRFSVAMAVAAAADGLSFLEVFPPGYVAVVVVDMVVALVLWALLGRGLVLLLALVFEAVPGLGLFPFWTLAVLSSEALNAAMETRLQKFRGKGG
jgi:hypothetical protein